ncbi:MAG: alkaline phosphatase family protein [Clostridia bacterium]|nr:alkaline phosphatase family protein [Clostridia bacterium]
MSQCKHVVIFGLDAIGTFIQNVETPELDRIFGSGAYTYRALCAPCTGSPEGWGSILTGTAPKAHGLYWPVYANDPTRLQPTVFSHIRKAMPDAVMGSFCEWTDLNQYIIEDGLGIHKRDLNGQALVDHACAFLAENKPEFLFTYFEIPDDRGHTYGFGTIPYYNGIRDCDRYVGQHYDAAEKAGMTLENTLFIAVGDHGGLNYAHGGMSDSEKYVYLAIAGCGVEPGDLGEISLRDTAAMVLHALGIPLPDFDPAGWTAQIPQGLFTDDSGCAYTPVTVLHRNQPAQLPWDTAPIAYRGEEGIGTLLGDKAPILALCFDDDLSDATGNYQTVPCYRDGAPTVTRKYGGKGIRHVPGGIRGNAILYERDGYLSIPNFTPGNGSFSVALWFRLEHEWYRDQSTDTVFSTKSYANRNSDGVSLQIGDSTITLHLQSGDAAALLGRNETDIRVGAHTFPEAFNGGWIHLILSVDRENRIYRLYCGFEELGSEAIPSSLDGRSLDGCGELRIGHQTPSTDCSAITNQYMMDDFLWFDRALTPEDVALLRSCYYR